MPFQLNLIAAIVVLSGTGTVAGQIVVDMPAPPVTATAPAAEDTPPANTGVAIAGYLGRAAPRATYGWYSGPSYLARAIAARRYAAMYSYGSYFRYGHVPWVFFGHGHHHHGHHGHRGHRFGIGSGGIHGHFSKHGSNLTIDFRFRP